MKVARRLLIPSAAIFCISLSGLSAQELLKSHRQFAKQGILPISAGSLYARLQWPGGNSVFDHFYDGKPYSDLQSVQTSNAGELPPPSPGRQEINVAPSTAHPIVPAKGSRKAKDVLQKAPATPHFSGVPRLVQISALTGVIVFLLLAIARLFQILGARGIERRISVADLPASAPVREIAHSISGSAGGEPTSLADVVTAEAQIGDGADAEFSKPSASRENFPPRLATTPLPLSEQPTRRDADRKATPESIAEIGERSSALLRSEIDFSRRIDIDWREPLQLPETWEESRRPDPMSQSFAPPPAETSPEPAHFIPSIDARSAQDGAAPQPTVDLAESDAALDLPEALAREVRHVRVTGGNLRHNHLYLPLDFFPADAIGGSNESLAAPKTVTVAFQPGMAVETDIDGTKRILRNRSAVRDFLARAAISEGDPVRITRTGPYSYEFARGAPGAILESAAGPHAPPAAAIGERPSITVADADNARARESGADLAESAPAEHAIGPSESVTQAALGSPVNDTELMNQTQTEGALWELSEPLSAPVVEPAFQSNVDALSGRETPDTRVVVEVSVSAPAEAQAPSAQEEESTEDSTPAAERYSLDLKSERDDNSRRVLTLEEMKEAAAETSPEPAPVDHVSFGVESVSAPPMEVIATGVPASDLSPTSKISEPEPVEKELGPTADEAATSLVETGRKIHRIADAGLRPIAPVSVVPPPPGPKRAPAPEAEAYARPGQKWKDELFGEILSRARIDAPDGRPLYAYSFTATEFEHITAFLRRRIRFADPLESTGAAFVFWAAEHIRAHFPRSDERHLNWAFLFNALGLDEDQNLARSLVALGLGWWDRDAKEAANGKQLYLYSLLVEGGLPEALLRQEGLYQRVIRGLLEDIEAAGGARCDLAALEPMAKRWSIELPSIFQDADLIRLLAEFGLALASLRAALPVGLAPEKIQNWLAENSPNWAETLPLRVSAETVNRLIVPALQIARGAPAPASGGRVVTRELRRDLEGFWRGFVRFDPGWIPAALLPEAQDLRLRLTPGGELAASGAATYLFATPEKGGWTVNVHGSRGPAPLAPSAPVRFTAFADGRSKGEIELDGGLADTVDEISLWRPADDYDGASPEVLIPASGGRTCAPCLFALGPADARPMASDGLSLQGSERADGGALWRVSGKGELTFGEIRLAVHTASDTDAPGARLVAFGETLSGWKTARGANLVFLGRPRLLGQQGLEDYKEIPSFNLVSRKTRGRVFAEYVAEWQVKGATLARLRYLSLPENTRIDLSEIGGGEARLRIDDLSISGLHASARAGDVSARVALTGGAGEIVLKTDGAPPGEIMLRLDDPAAGTALELVASWPARRGMMLHIGGRPLTRRTAIAVEELCEWRAIVPSAKTGKLHVAFAGRKIGLPVSGETPLGVHLPLIRALLAQGGSDAQVNICLDVDGREGPPLEARRYADNAIIQNGVLHVGLGRNARAPADNAFSEALAARRPVKLHIVDLREGAVIRLDAEAPCDLRKTLGESGGRWMIQARLDERPQRPVVFDPCQPAETAETKLDAVDPRPSAQTEQGAPVGRYVRRWQTIVENPLDPTWAREWSVIEALAQGGDPGFFLQTQALAKVPEAAVMLALRVKQKSLEQALSLDLAAPVFWATLPVKAFVTAVEKDYERRRAPLLQNFDAAEAGEEAARRLFERISDILALRPALAAHFGRGLANTGLIGRVYRYDAQEGLRDLLALRTSLDDLAMDAARRFDVLPKGLSRLSPQRLRLGRSFHPDTQAVVDAPIVAAEIAAGLRPAASMAETTMLIGLRYVDPAYFDAAVPVALNLALEKN